MADHYKSFGNDTAAVDNKGVVQVNDFDVFCAEVKDTLVKNNRQHRRVREICNLFKEPSIIKKVYETKIKMSPNLEYAVSIPLKDKTRAMIGSVAPNTFKIGQLVEVFRGTSKIRSIIFSSDSTLVMIANDDKLGVYSTITKKMIVTVTADEL